MSISLSASLTYGISITMASGVFTKVTTPVKDAALEAAKAARARWHLIDAKDQVNVVLVTERGL